MRSIQLPIKALTYFMIPVFVLVSMTYSGCIEEDDGTPPTLTLPVMTITDLTVQEGDIDQLMQLTVTLTGENTTNAIVTFSAVAETADANFDYELLTTGQLIFAPGETQKTIEINLVGDEVREPRESFTIQLYNPLNTYVEKAISTITIEDDDYNTAGLVIPSGGYQSPESYEGYNLVWSDEFDGETLNLADWTYEIGDGCPNNCGWGNNELEYYREDNTSLVDGHLVITAKQQNFGDHDYTSSRLVTKGKKQFKFGRIDIRAALPKGQGIWPALWMLGSNIDAVGWPACGEIDIMELTGDLPNRILGTIHYGANTSEHEFNSGTKYLDGQATFQDEFHVFSINWENNLIEFLLDGEVYHTITPATLNGAAYPFNKNQFFIFNVAVGGNWPGSPDASTAFPQHMIVDYVKVFQK
ncbi:MAG: family 16 glycosylhydrolase [Saprospiraceae bacterium]|nr:family 16 glycosylhydrolase [Saprospiraceae bacterium]